MATTFNPSLQSMPWDVRWADRLARVLMACAVLAFVVVGVRWFIRLPMFAVKAIVVDGDLQHNSRASLRGHAVPRMEGNVFTMDLAQAQRAFETAPWVRRAIVRRVWPDRLHVSLQEHRAAAYWHQDDRDAMVVNTFGETFAANVADVDEEGLPFLQGPEGTASQVLTMHEKLAPVFSKLAVHIESLELSTRGAWRLELDNGSRVELGRGTDDEVLARSQAFVDTLPQLTARYQAPLIYADLRHRDGYAIRLKGVGTTDVVPVPNKTPRPTAPRIAPANVAPQAPAPLDR